MGQKRSYATMDTEKDVGNAASASTLLPIFEAFRAELDEYED